MFAFKMLYDVTKYHPLEMFHVASTDDWMLDHVEIRTVLTNAFPFVINRLIG